MYPPRKENFPKKKTALLVLLRVGDGFDVVAFGVADEGAVVGVVLFGPDPWLVQDFGAE